MGSQSSSTSLPSQVAEAGAWDSRPTVTEKSELVNEKAGAGNPGRTVTEKPEEQNEKAYASKPPTDHRSTFLRFPREIRNIIYSYALAVENGYICGVSRGVICLADEPGYPPKLCSLAYMHTGYQLLVKLEWTTLPLCHFATLPLCHFATTSATTAFQITRNS
ncbi:hypothetical protein K469DRAFT_713585 [Zopfia rhizophila CBS 207.26]|uniref:Uncharacterized protein n=1 Tax=Zopfia rhizophila CBS 207.26 TaxID=1314779 RepID=A0A6A6DR65_9PEZI|nr:hypothetical protein K469DRAFT_713585 [Zopfia rhizophila CBS 207.26]